MARRSYKACLLVWHDPLSGRTRDVPAAGARKKGKDRKQEESAECSQGRKEGRTDPTEADNFSGYPPKDSHCTKSEVGEDEGWKEGGIEGEIRNADKMRGRYVA